MKIINFLDKELNTNKNYFIKKKECETKRVFHNARFFKRVYYLLERERLYERRENGRERGISRLPTEQGARGGGCGAQS